MPNVSNPDDELMTAQQAKDLRHPLDSDAKQVRKQQNETAGERIEADVRSNEGIGAAAFAERRKSETEEALERARRAAREQVPTGRRRRP